MPLGGAGDREFHFAQQFVVVVNESHVQCDGLAHAGLGEVFLHSLAIALVRQLLAELGEVVLAVGILHVGQELRPLAHPMTATAEQIAGRAHLRRIDVGHQQHAPAQQHGNLVGVTLVVLGRAPMNRLHIESLPQDKGNALLRTEVRQPVPGEDTLHRHDQLRAVGGYDA